MTKTHSLPQGFLAAGTHSGLKADDDKNDLSLFVSKIPCVAAGVFTQNRVCGAPVKLSRNRVPSSSVRAVIINSGNANACTGERGDRDALSMTENTADVLDCNADDILVCSTGVIGQFLPMENIEMGLPHLKAALSHESSAFLQAAQGMMTTDTFPKLASRRIDIGKTTMTISGAAKGAAMIAPNMATMLAIVMTDVVLDETSADAMLRDAVNRSFNCISVEGHTSTSDSVILLANGASGVNLSTESDREQFQQALNDLCIELAQAIIRDAEGADHFIEITVEGARNKEEARRLERRSPTVRWSKRPSPEPTPTGDASFLPWVTPTWNWPKRTFLLRSMKQKSTKKVFPFRSTQRSYRQT